MPSYELYFLLLENIHSSAGNRRKIILIAVVARAMKKTSKHLQWAREQRLEFSQRRKWRDYYRNGAKAGWQSWLYKISLINTHQCTSFLLFSIPELQNVQIPPVPTWQTPTCLLTLILLWIAACGDLTVWKYWNFKTERSPFPLPGPSPGPWLQLMWLLVCLRLEVAAMAWMPFPQNGTGQPAWSWAQPISMHH